MPMPSQMASTCTSSCTWIPITDFISRSGGVIREVRNIHGRVYLDVNRASDGSLRPVRGDDFQFNQERGLVVVETEDLGLVAIVPVGMSLISSVALTPAAGATLRKGEEIGYFQFGGSDIVILFQDEAVELEAEVGKKYLQGQRMGYRPEVPSRENRSPKP